MASAPFVAAAAALYRLKPFENDLKCYCYVLRHNRQLVVEISTSSGEAAHEKRTKTRQLCHG
jgi:hypothetical protein